MKTRITKALRQRIIELYCDSTPIWKIAQILNITEAQVVRVLGKY